MMLSLSYLPSRIPQAVEEKLPPAVVMKLDVEGKEVELKILSCGVICLDLKMAIILPTGQWYAPSAVINDA